ncbi:MAG: sugar isomerase [Saprospiraceae bacterium]|nr:sugar isomerase [Saprospiraceae bacterium]
MTIHTSHIEAHNDKRIGEHRAQYAFLEQQLDKKGLRADDIAKRVAAFQVAVPSWALGAGGTRFGRFPIGGEPGNLTQKLDDAGLLHALTRSAGAISLHIPWDVPTDPAATREQADALGIRFDAVNSNTFQDQPGQHLSYKFGSLCNVTPAVRQQAIEHNLEVIEIGRQLGSKAITVWLADGSSFPGQLDFRRALLHTQEALQEIYRHLPDDWRMFIEYKPYEPNFYSMVVQDWGTSYFLAQCCGEKAFCLVDLGHHLPNTNIEQIVATLLMLRKLGGFHFNDSKYGDDDLTTGSIRPYQLFLIFNELVDGMEANELAWMIDASHNLKDPLEDLMQSLEAIRLAFAQALLVDRDALREAQADNDVTRAQTLLQDAFRTDVRPLLREARRRSGAALEPLELYRDLNVRGRLIAERGTKTVATGL